MKRTQITIIALLILTAILASQAYSQLVIQDNEYRVIRVDVEKRRIEVNSISGNPKKASRYVNITGETLVQHDNNPFNWEHIKEGWIIRVKGGVRMDLGISAEKIWILDTTLPSP